jgi:hypothetical protein
LVKDFGRLSAAAQTEGVPIWRVGTPAEREMARQLFRGIADKIIERAK